MKNSITYHFLRCILWIFGINWPVAIIKTEGHSLFSWVPSAIKPTVNLTTEGKGERPIHFEADQKVSILKLTESLSRICIVEKEWQIVYPLFNFLWCSDWGGDIHDRPAEAFLLRGSFTTAKVFQGVYNKYNLVDLHIIYTLAGKLYDPSDISLPFFRFTENHTTEMRPQVKKQNQFSHCIAENAGVFPHFPLALSRLQANASVPGLHTTNLAFSG